PRGVEGQGERGRADLVQLVRGGLARHGRGHGKGARTADGARDRRSLRSDRGLLGGQAGREAEEGRREGARLTAGKGGAGVPPRGRTPLRDGTSTAWRRGRRVPRPLSGGASR